MSLRSAPDERHPRHGANAPAGQSEPVERRDYARTILGAGRHCSPCSTTFSDLSRVEAGRLKIERAPFRPADLLHEVQALFNESALQKQLGLSVVWSGNNHDCYLGDSHRLTQMLSNLFSNALKFTVRDRLTFTAAKWNEMVSQPYWNSQRCRYRHRHSGRQSGTCFSSRSVRRQFDHAKIRRIGSGLVHREQSCATDGWNSRRR